MISSKEYIRAWESRVGLRTLHFADRYFNDEDLHYLLTQYNKVISEYNLKNKKIIDLGCGGGLFGCYLGEKSIEIKKYIGVDIAQRCISETRLNNLGWDDGIADVVLIDPIEFLDFKKVKGNIIVVLNVVPYLPDLEYTKLFFNKLNNSKVKDIIINFKKSNKNIFREKPYKTTGDIGNACSLELSFITGLMNNYHSNKIKNDNKYCYIYFKKNVKKKEVVK